LTFVDHESRDVPKRVQILDLPGKAHTPGGFRDDEVG